MSSIEDGTLAALAKAKRLSALAGLPENDPNLHLAVIAGTMEGYTRLVREANTLPTTSVAEEILDALYAVLGDYEREKLERGLQND